MEKKKIKERIFHKYYTNPDADILFDDLPKDLLPTDEIRIDRDYEGYYSEDNSWDAHATLEIYRERDETDKEFQKRLADDIRDKKLAKKRRYENYLKLKKEFKNEPEPE